MNRRSEITRTLGHLKLDFRQFLGEHIKLFWSNFVQNGVDLEHSIDEAASVRHLLSIKCEGKMEHFKGTPTCFVRGSFWGCQVGFLR